MEHIAIMDKKTIDMILNGTKTIETRFSKNKITPYNRITIGEIIYLKETGGPITTTFIVDKVLYFEDLNEEKINEIKDKYNKFINAKDDYWDYKKNCNYGILIYIRDSKRIEPIKIIKKNRQAFLTFNNIKDNIIEK